MFQHMLLAVDGSDLPVAALHKAISFAHDSLARVTAIHVIPDLRLHGYQVVMLAGLRERYEQEARKAIAGHLRTVSTEAEAANVRCDTVSVIHAHPYEAIIHVAQERACDLIVMAMHGRRGIQGILHGRETQKLLAHSDIPVLVYQ
ncbi:universal stress protein [Cupriavidus basilensis]|uniref:universal stress protein n=1 Tax=Cupriavidus basilensis TaxID=68895 RepID=UPI0005B87B95|nr:universal stress protein [Cupriavidus basilensis]